VPGDVRKTDAESGCRDELARFRPIQANFAASQRPVSKTGVPEGTLSGPERAKSNNPQAQAFEWQNRQNR